MKNEDLFNYQYEAMRLLINGFDKDRMVHAYLLDGEAGTGSIDAAKYMAKKLICKKDNAPCMSCGDCKSCLLYTSPSPRDLSTSRMPSSA